MKIKLKLRHFQPSPGHNNLLVETANAQNTVTSQLQ